MIIKKSIMMLFIIFLVIISDTETKACMSFRLVAEDGTQLVTRTMEFAFDLKYQISIVPRDYEFRSRTPKDSSGLIWKTKYAFVNIANFAVTESSTEGMNEAGLTASALYFEPDTKYPDINEADYSQALAHVEIPTWILSNFSTVDEVRKGMSTLKVFGLIVQQLGGVPPLHFIVTDKNGGCIVIEFEYGQMHIYDNPLGVLTNSPNFPWHMANIRQYIGMNPYRPDDKVIHGLKIIPTGEGSGMVGLPADLTPPGRFVRAFYYTNNCDIPQDKPELLNLAQHIGNNFSIFNGLIIKKTNIGTPGNRETTQWTTYKDLTNGIFYFKTYDNPDLRMIDLNKIDKNAKKIKTIDMYSRKQMIYDLTNEAK